MKTENQWFIENAERFIASQHLVEILNSERLRDDGRPKYEAIREAISARQFIEAHWSDVARSMESVGEDSTDLIAFKNQVNGAAAGLSIEGAAKLWPAVRVRLERLALKTSIAPAESGTVVDESAWVLISKLQPPRVPNIRERKRYLEKHSEIRTRRPLTKAGKPNPRRLEVHIGDWVKHWDKVDQQTFDSLDSADAAPLTNDELVGDYMDGVKKLYIKISQGKRPRE